MKRMIALACGMLWSACTSALFYQTFEAVEPCAGLVCPEIEWVDIDFDSGLQVMKTEVTVAQYRDCVDAGVCFLPAAHEAWTSGSESCLTDATWLRTDEASRSMPINCLSRGHAERFANWVGARLPSAEEWLHAATSEGAHTTHGVMNSRRMRLERLCARDRHGLWAPGAAPPVLDRGTAIKGSAIWSVTWPKCSPTDNLPSAVIMRSVRPM